MFHIIFTGTFAVVSLMVGQVVNRGYQMHLGESAEIVNTTFSVMTSNGTTSNPVIKPLVTQPPVEVEGYANPVKLGYALSVTFVVGCLQVSPYCIQCTVLPAKSDSDVMFCPQIYQGLRINRSLVY